MFEETHGGAVAGEHEVFAEEGAGVGEAIGKLLVGGEQEQARSLRAVGANNNRLSSLQMRIALLIEIDCASDAAQLVRFDAVDVRVRPNLAAPSALRQRDDAGK